MRDPVACGSPGKLGKGRGVRPESGEHAKDQQTPRAARRNAGYRERLPILQGHTAYFNKPTDIPGVSNDDHAPRKAGSGDAQGKERAVSVLYELRSGEHRRGCRAPQRRQGRPEAAQSAGRGGKCA